MFVTHADHSFQSWVRLTVTHYVDAPPMPAKPPLRCKRRGDLLDLLMRHGCLVEPMAPEGVKILAGGGLEGSAQIVRGHLAPSVAGGEVVQRRFENVGSDLI